MMSILIANGDLSALENDGAAVRMNGQLTSIRRVGGYLVYADSDVLHRCRIVGEFSMIDGSGVPGRQFFCASSGQDPAECSVYAVDGNPLPNGGG